MSEPLVEYPELTDPEVRRSFLAAWWRAGIAMRPLPGVVVIEGDISEPRAAFAYRPLLPAPAYPAPSPHELLSLALNRLDELQHIIGDEVGHSFLQEAIAALLELDVQLVPPSNGGEA